MLRRRQFCIAVSKGDGGFLVHADAFNYITEGIGSLKEKEVHLLEQRGSNSAAARRIHDAVNILNAGTAAITQWDECVIRQLVDTYGEGFDGGQDSGLTPGRYGDRADGRGPVI